MKIFARILTVAALLVPLVSINAAAQDKPKVIRVYGQGAGFGKPYGNQVIGVLRDRSLLEKEFEKDGIKVEWTFATGTGPAINEAIANGQADFANYGGLPNIVGKAAGLPTKILASYGIGNVYLAVRANAGIDKIEDLKGKKVAVAFGTINHLGFQRFLDLHKLTPKDLKVVNLKAGDQVSALQAGTVDAAFGGSNFLNLEDKKLVKILFDTRGEPSPVNNFGAFTVTESFAKQYPDVVRRVVKNFVIAARWASDDANRQEVFNIWAKTGIPADAYADDFLNQPLRERLSPLLDDFVLARYREGVVFSREEGFIRQDVDLSKWIDTSYLDAALKELNLQNYWPRRDAAGKVKKG
ncbi:MAG: ABC transporter substrate-binding protein [Rhodocyclaceae bacterium]